MITIPFLYDLSQGKQQMKQRNAATARGNTAMGIAQKLFIRPDTNMIKFSIHQ